MKKRNLLCLGLLLVLVLTFNLAFRKVKPFENIGIAVDTLATNLRVPWQLVFLPDNSLLFTERPGRVRIYRNGSLKEKPALQVKDILAESKTGLLGMVLHPKYASNQFIYIAHNYQNQKGLWLKVMRYVFKNDSLITPQLIIDGIPAARNHTGCRLIFGPDAKLYITTGDADRTVLAQDLKTYNGKILRVNDDGTIPDDNPFVKNDTAKKEIWSYGHRNPQGIAFNPTNKLLYEAEHGPTGGDEINQITKATNYGWPAIHHLDKRAGMVSPLFEYTPSIGPSEAMFYSGKAFPGLKGNFLVALLRGEGILSVKLDGEKVVGQELLLEKKYGRIRSIVQGPDGYLYVSTSNYDLPERKGEAPYDLILRIRPSASSNTFLVSRPIQAEVEGVGNALTSAARQYKQLCASCHGDVFEGTERAKSWIGGKFAFGADHGSIVKNITYGLIDKGMPAWNGAMSKQEISELADYIVKETNK